MANRYEVKARATAEKAEFTDVAAFSPSASASAAASASGADIKTTAAKNTKPKRMDVELPRDIICKQGKRKEYYTNVIKLFLNKVWKRSKLGEFFQKIV